MSLKIEHLNHMTISHTVKITSFSESLARATHRSLANIIQHHVSRLGMCHWHSSTNAIFQNYRIPATFLGLFIKSTTFHWPRWVVSHAVQSQGQILWTDNVVKSTDERRERENETLNWDSSWSVALFFSSSTLRCSATRRMSSMSNCQ